jgi:hypothetical protein
MRCVHETIVVVEKQQILHISMCVLARECMCVRACVWLWVGRRGFVCLYTCSITYYYWLHVILLTTVRALCLSRAEYFAAHKSSKKYEQTSFNKCGNTDTCPRAPLKNCVFYCVDFLQTHTKFLKFLDILFFFYGATAQRGPGLPHSWCF